MKVFGTRPVSVLTLLAGLSATRLVSAQPAPEPQPAPTTPTYSPSRDADPAPLLPTPQAAEAMPLSTQGTAVYDQLLGTPPPRPVPEGPSASDARMHALERRLAEQDRKIHRLEEGNVFRHLKIGGFIQPQLIVPSFEASASPNRTPSGLPDGVSANDAVARPDGTTTNGTMFRLRRTRLRVFYETDVMRFFLQLDALPLGGTAAGVGTVVRNAEATGKIRWNHDIKSEVTAGVFFTPFRYEMTEASIDRPFIERTWFVQNVFPAERDIGAHVKTTAMKNRITLDLGVVNGQRLGEPRFVVQPDLNRSKDFVGWLSYDAGPFAVGANAYVGRGQLVDGPNLRFKQFGRWAVNYWAQAKWPIWKRLGTTRVIAELAVTENMDTGIIYPWALPAIPARFTDDVTDQHGRAVYVRVEQELGRWFLAGYRFDSYTPDTSIENNARDTHSLLAVARFSKNLRFMNELGWATDNVHPQGTPAPSRGALVFSSVLQAMF